MSSPFLDADQIRATTFVRHVEIHETLGSTNERAVELARNAAIPLPALVSARRQTAGRGRGRSTWWAADGALTFSLLVDTAATGIVPASWPQLSLATAVAVCDALELRIAESYGNAGSRGREHNPQSEIRNPKSHVSLKWPNDVLLAGRKICGVLIESPGGAKPAKDRLIIGIGINVNNSWQAAPKEIRSTGIALSDYTSTNHDLQEVMVDTLNALCDRMRQLQRGDAELIDAWQRLHALAGRRFVVWSDQRSVEGQCCEIAHDGALVVDTRAGRQRFYSGSVRLV
jgi:BirA family biotin operon repressor/biotin-[acetyl-CoA-carboxylase] ligase